MRMALSSLLLSLNFLSAGECAAQLPPDKAPLTPAGDLRVQIFAHEPQLFSPSAFDIDEHGRIWVAEAVNYRKAAGTKTKEPPFFLTPHRKTGDRIVVLEDTDGDGKCDTSRVFAEGLDLTAPKGFAVIGDRVWISQSPNIVTIEIKPDGTAGKKETVLTGFGGIHGDHSVHSVTMGPDGRLYSCFGDTGCDTKFPDGRRLVTNGKPCRGGCVFRMNYDLSGAEIIAHNFRNGYEAAVDSFGNVFMSDNDEDDGNQFCRLVYVMEGGNYGWQPYQKGFDWNLESPGVAPILMRTGAGAPSGLCVYEGKLLPARYRGMPILAECGAGWVGSFPLVRHGAGYRVYGVDDASAIRRPDLALSSSDRWFRPSDVAVAPDGSLFVADFYNHIAGGRDLSQPMRGRIYRLIAKDHDGSYRVPALELTTPAGLIEALGSPNQARRARAILHIKEPGPKALPTLIAHAKSADRVLRARVLFQLGLLGGEGQKHVRAALTDKDPDMRIVAIRSLKQNGGDMVDIAKSMVKDPAPQVRRELLLSLRESAPDIAQDVLIALANQYDGRDRYYLEAVAIAFRGRDAALTSELMRSWPKDEWSRRVAGLLWVLGPPEALPTFTSIALDRKRDPAEREIAIEALGGLNDMKAGIVLAKLVAEEDSKELVRKALSFLARKSAWPWRGLPKSADPFGSKLPDVALRLAQDATLHPEALNLSRTLGTRPLSQWMLSQPFTKLPRSYPPEKAEKPEQTHDWTRARLNPDGAVDVASQRSPRTDMVAYAATLLNAKAEFATRLWVGSSAGIKIWLNNKLVHDHRTERPLTARQDTVPITLEAGVNRLLVRAEAGRKEWAYVVELEDPLGRATEITDSSLPKIAAPASERLDPKKLPPDRELLALKGDAERGRQVFLRTKANCVSCHKIKDEGGTTGVGPALDGLGVKMSREAILAEILRPSQSILSQYAVWNVQTKDGKSLAGVMIEDTPKTVVLKDALGKATTIKTLDIEVRGRSDVSLMPELLAGEFTRQELADLLQFLGELR